jgi:hypothetical protein
MPGLFSFRRGKRDAARTKGADSLPDEASSATGGAGAGSTTGTGTTGTTTTRTGPAASTASSSIAAGAGSSSGSSAVRDHEDESSDPANAETEGMWVVIRPAAIVPEHAARRILVELARRDLGNGGEWQCEPQLWSRFDGPTSDQPDGQPPVLMGTIHVTYGTPTKYEITLYRVSITAEGVAGGWSVPTLTDEALGFGGLTLAQCPRAMVQPPPQPFRY